MELCEHGNTFNCLQCEVKNLNYVIQELIEQKHRITRENEELRRKIERYEEALKWYANRENYNRSENDIITGYPPEIMNDKGFEARKALKN